KCSTYCAATSSAGLLTQPTVSTLSTFFKLIDLLLTPRFSITYVCHDVWHGSCLGERCDASNQLRAFMWKITTRGVNLEEVLIMAAMNLLTSADTAAKSEKRASPK